MKTLLVHCARYNNITPVVTMGLWGLADVISHAGAECEVIHTGVEQQITGNFCIENYITSDVEIVGFSAHWFPMLQECLDLAKRIKESYPHVFIVFGGYTASLFAKEIVKTYEAVDAIIVGDGEVPFEQLVKQWIGKKQNLKEVTNLVYKLEYEVCANPVDYVATAQSIRNIQMASMDKYLRNYEWAKHKGIFDLPYGGFCNFPVEQFLKEPTFFLLTGKGCHVDCLYCGGGKTAQELINHRKTCMFVEDEQIIETIEDAQKLGYNNFYVCYDPKPYNARYHSWLKRIREKKLDIGLMFGFWALPTFEQIDEFVATSDKLLFEISPETACDELRGRVRGFTFQNEDFYKTLGYLYEKKVSTLVYYTYPLMFERVEDVKLTRRDFWKINTMYPAYIEAFYMKLSTDPGSPVYQKPEEYDTSLIVNSLEDHLKLCSSTNDGNIMIHKIHSIAKEVQDELYNRIILDTLFKCTFRVYVKEIVRAFETVEDFIIFMDAFYDESGFAKDYLKHKDKLLMQGEFMISAFQEYVLANKEKAKTYLPDLIAFYKAMTIFERKNTSLTDKNGLVLCDNVNICSTDYEIYEAVKKIEKKEFCEFEQLRQSEMYLFVKVNEKVDVFDINDAFYLLLEHIGKKPGVQKEELLLLTSQEFTDESDELEMISSELSVVVNSLLQQKIIQYGIDR
ncbi:B12-binding domain-containing radical SAM protein [Clostridium sp. UBA1652]|uniref:B12-binding domain-containing radical SAM protein n=1 Tax=Clostridium sp. UBA1652 TaxID=1946348 RepID=UPI00257CAEFB|nr:cobalamin-dependent protein [Clostridium sp. UBA1652]